MVAGDSARIVNQHQRFLSSKSNRGIHHYERRAINLSLSLVEHLPLSLEVEPVDRDPSTCLQVIRG